MAKRNEWKGRKGEGNFEKKNEEGKERGCELEMMMKKGGRGERKDGENERKNTTATLMKQQH